jgi:hypothetical protein
MARIMYESLVHAVMTKTTTSRDMTQAIKEITVRKGRSADTMMLIW